MSNNLVLIDTSVWIFALSKNFLPEIKERVDHLLRENTVCICAMIKLELLGRAKTKKKNLKNLKQDYPLFTKLR